MQNVSEFSVLLVMVTFWDVKIDGQFRREIEQPKVGGAQEMVAEQQEQGYRKIWQELIMRSLETFCHKVQLQWTRG